MANCSKCGKPLAEGEKFCASCGTPVKPATAKPAAAKSAAAKPATAKPATAKPAAAKKSSAVTAAVGGVAMSKIALIVVTAACGVIVVFFFFSFFAVSFTTSNNSLGSYLGSYLSDSIADLNTSVSGIESAFGSESGSSRTGGTNPALVLVWFLSIAMLVAIYVPVIRQKLESVQLPAINIPVIGGMGIYAYLAIIIAFIGLIILIAAYASTMGYLRRVYSAYGSALSMLGSIRIHAGIGFVMTVLAHLVLLGIPFADKYLLNKRG